MYWICQNTSTYNEVLAIEYL